MFHSGTSHNHLDFVVVIFLARDKIDNSPKYLFKIKFWLHYMYNFVKIDSYQDNVLWTSTELPSAELWSLKMFTTA